MSKTIKKDELFSTVEGMSLPDFLELIDHYQETNNEDLLKKSLELTEHDLQAHLLSIGHHKTCPYCSSTLIKANGHRGVIQRFKCLSCNKTYTVFTGTLLEKTKFSWDVWIEMVKMVMANESIDIMIKRLEDDYNLTGIERKTVIVLRLKILHAMAQMPMPKLSGVIQIDETFFRENQKGSKKLVSTIGEVRKPRKGLQPSKYGVMGNEFANVVCAVDDSGHVVAKVIGLGKLELEAFYNEFDEYIENPTFLCTDGNLIYQKYTKFKKIFFRFFYKSPLYQLFIIFFIFNISIILLLFFFSKLLSLNSIFERS